MKAAKQPLMTSCILAVALVCVWPIIAFAGGPLRLKASGQPVVWPNGGRNITFRTDLGGLGPMSNAEAVAQTAAAFGQWEAIPTATATYVNGGALPVDVDENNFFPFLFGPPDMMNSLIYDEDGAIFNLIFGEDSGILGLTHIEFDVASGEIVDANIALNGAAVDTRVPAPEFLEVQVHEIGHLSGLGHSVVNGEIFTIGDHTGPTPTDTFPRPASPDGIIETMYPFRIPGGRVETPRADDRAIFSTLYPEPGFFANSGTITGRILGLNGRTPVNGVNVIARNIANPFVDAVSAISGNFAATDDPDTPQAGVYTLNGLTPGAQYVVYVDEIGPGGFSTVPRFSLPGPEEFYNGAAESDNFSTVDNPGDFTPVTAVAGRPRTGIDITFNRLRPGPIPIEALIGFESAHPWVELLLPFRFEIGGQKFDTAFLNVLNGSLTFGEPDFFPIFSEKAFKQHLLGPPRIAGLMVPLDPYSFGTGVLSFDETTDTFIVRYTDVPEFLENGSAGGANTFSITLRDKERGRKNLATLSYGDIDVDNAVVGYSCGSRITSGFEQESDLSTLAGRLIRGQSQSAIAEEFVNSDIDLARRTLTFEMPGAFTDQFEPNNSRARATRVNLPFNTVDKFVEITPGDVDIYRFRAKAGEILVAETVTPGVPFFALDTLIGLFGPQGNLLAENDGILPFLPSSRLIFTVPADGEYTLAVTTSDDVNFTGAESQSGRYNLTLDTYKGTILPLDGDDVTHELPLRFAFPFQGNEWRSVWVSSNGNLTFGAPEIVTTIEDMQLEGFLNGPPRVAPYFTDLDPSGTFNFGVTGFVIAEQNQHSLTVHWVSVPKILDFDTNSFSVTINSEGDIRMKWGAGIGEDLSFRGTIVGITEGGGGLDPGPSDLSRLKNASGTGTFYEQFAGFLLRRGGHITRASDIPSFDLSFDKLRFGGNDDDDDDDRPQTMRALTSGTGVSGRQNE